MFEQIRLFWRLRKIVPRLKGIFKMKFSVNMIIQILALIVQVLNQISDLFPEDQRAIVVAIVGVIQATVALMGHFKNPDGTPVEVAYVKKTKKLV